MMSNTLSETHAAIRSRFPSLGRIGPEGKPWVHLDGPGGTQVPGSVAAAISDSIIMANANRGAAFHSSALVEELMARAGSLCADFLGIDDPRRVIFGPNMTTLAFHLADALVPELSTGDEIVVSRLDHDAHVSPWLHAARRSGATVRHLDFCRQSFAIQPDMLARVIGPRTKWIAFTAASNALGSLVAVNELIKVARTTNAIVSIDGTHLAPHLLPEVDSWDADFFFCSGYKFFGPHVGIMAGKIKWLESLNPARVRPAGEKLPVRWMTGTQNHEGIAGLVAALEYLAELGDDQVDFRSKLRSAYQRIAGHEASLARLFFERLRSQNIWKLIGPNQADPTTRVATFALSGPVPPRQAAEVLAKRGICAYSGNFYALPVTEALGLEPSGGLLRVGAVHYNTAEEIHRLWDALDAIR